MIGEVDYFWNERYRGLQAVRELPAALATEVESALSALRAAGAFPEPDPDAFSQELLLAYDPAVRADYLAGRVRFPFYRRAGEEFFWRSLRGQTPHIDRVAETFPLLDAPLLEQLWIERGRGISRALPAPAERRRRWRQAEGLTVDLPPQAASRGPYAAAFVTPRFGIGGSEKVIRQMIGALEGLTGLPSLVVVADAAVEPAELPPDALCLPNLSLWGEPFLRAPQAARARCLRDVLVYSGAPRAFCVNSALGTALFESGALREDGVAAAEAIFLAGVGPGGSSRGYVKNADWLVDAGVTLFTDNAAMARRLSSQSACEDPVVLSMPAEVAEGPPPDGERVLWAGRIDAQKRPELLVETARELPGLVFEVWGAPLMSGEAAMRAIAAQPNIVYRGPFDDFGALDLSRIGAMLYTSAYDGTPNLLLEAMGRGLACVCSAVGGVPDLMAEGRGSLIDSAAPASAHAAALQVLLSDPARRRRMGEAARDHIRSRHTQDGFRSDLARLLAAMHAGTAR